MAKSRKKKTIGQQVVSVATVGMPAPVRNVASSRWGARLFLILAAALFSAGIVSVQWKDGRPKLEVDRERAQEVREKIVHGIKSAEESNKSESHSFPSLNSTKEGWQAEQSGARLLSR